MDGRGEPFGVRFERMTGVHAWPTIEAWAEGVADRVCDLLKQRIRAAEGHVVPLTIALSGGNSPPPAHRALAARLRCEQSLATRCRWFQVDERSVLPDDADRNGRMIRETLFGGEGAPVLNWYEIPWPCLGGNPAVIENGRSPAAEVALWACSEAYSKTLRAHLPADSQGIPIFDLVLLGMGEDGHTASLFPGTEDQMKTNEMFQPVWVERLKTWRFTLTMPVLTAARHAAVLVTGEKKSHLVRQVIAGEADHLPIGRLQAARRERGNDLEWWVQP